MNKRLLRFALPAAVAILAAGVFVTVQTPAQAPAGKAKAEPAKAQAKAQSKAASSAKGATDGTFYIHMSHVTTLGFDCDTCHVPTKAGSMVLKRPGHDQCMGCHSDKFDSIDQKLCSVCHAEYPPTSAQGLYQYPRYKKERAVLFEFSHAKHVDPKARLNDKTGFRADCTFCHKFEPKGEYATF